jgi:hypothetical protein
MLQEDEYIPASNPFLLETMRPHHCRMGKKIAGQLAQNMVKQPSFLKKGAESELPY